MKTFLQWLINVIETVKNLYTTKEPTLIGAAYDALPYEVVDPHVLYVPYHEIGRDTNQGLRSGHLFMTMDFSQPICTPSIPWQVLGAIPEPLTEEQIDRLRERIDADLESMTQKIIERRITPVKPVYASFEMSISELAKLRQQIADLRKARGE